MMPNCENVQSEAQNVTFGTITCRRLQVIDDGGKVSVILDTYEYDGAMAIFNNGRKNGLQASVGYRGGA